MNYEDMSDFEINKLVADSLRLAWYCKPESTPDGKTWIYSDNYSDNLRKNKHKHVELPDYCSNPSDAWPIIIENKIDNGYEQIRVSRNEYKDAWFANGDDGYETYTKSEKPLRACMICFLKMKDAEK